MDLIELQERIGVHFNDKTLLETALTHSSYLNEHPEVGRDHNERLAWLGDAVLYFLVTEALLDKHLDEGTGYLTELRKQFIDESRLATEAIQLKLGEALMMGKGEEGRNGRSNPKNLHAAYEAILGAIYRDKEIAVVREFILSSMLRE